MTVLVTDTGFSAVQAVASVTLADIAQHQGVLDLTNTDDPLLAKDYVSQLTLIRISFPAFSDGRAFTIARRLRMFGYTAELRATGPVIADQYAMARRVGFDSVEIPDDLAQRQPQEHWIYRADWREHDYQAQLRA